MNRILKGNLVLPDKVVSGTLVLEDGRIVKIIEDGDREENAPLVLPGFIDIHFHGLGKFGVGDLDSLRGIAAFAPSTGVARFTPAIGACPREEILAFLNNTKKLVDAPVQRGALCAGAHLEGPYLSCARRGGMPEEYLRIPDEGEIRELLEVSAGTLRLVTLAPEVEGAFSAIQLFRASGAAVSAGHTDASAELFFKAVDAGVSHVCHLFDTFSPREVREGVSQFSLADACLLDDRVTVELIADGFHVPEGLVRLAVRAAGPERIVVVTDAMQGTGLPDGIYVQEGAGEYLLDNATLCRTVAPPHEIVGSCLTMKRAFRNLVRKFGVGIPEASKMLSGNPARVIGLERETGTLREGLFADLCLFDGELNLMESIIAGETCFRR